MRNSINRFLAGVLTACVSALPFAAGSAQAAEYNQWRLVPQKQRDIAENAAPRADKDSDKNKAAQQEKAEQKKTVRQMPASIAAEAKPRRPRAARVLLVNIKDKNHKLAIGCRINSGRLQLNAVFAAAADTSKANDKRVSASVKKPVSAQNGEQRKTAGGEYRKSQKTTLNLAIDGKSILKDHDARRRAVAHGNIAVRANLRGDDSTLLISRFLSAQKTVAVAYGGNAEEIYTAAHAGEAGLALQNCLHK